MKFLRSILPLALLLLASATLVACNPAPPQPRVIQAVEPQARPASTPTPSAFVSSGKGFYPLMQHDGNERIALATFIACMDPSHATACPHSFHPSANWSHYASIINGRFGTQLSSYEAFKSFMASSRVTVIPCTTALINEYKMGRVSKTTGEISIDYRRRNCYQGRDGGVEKFFAVDGKPVLSDICGNGMEPLFVTEPPVVTYTPVCIGCRHGPRAQALGTGGDLLAPLHVK